MSKVGIGREHLGNNPVFRELQPVVVGDGVNLVSIGAQSLFDALTHWFGMFGV